MTRKYSPKYYQKNKEKILARNKAYQQKHVKEINEYDRVRRWKTRGLQAPERTFSFYRDVICWAQPQDPIWEEINSLPLTDRQRQLFDLTRQGKTQVEIADIMQLNQSSIAKTWNGNTDYAFQPPRLMGGIYKKLLRQRTPKPGQNQALIDNLIEQYQTRHKSPKLIKQLAAELQIPYQKAAEIIRQWKKEQNE